MIFSRTKINMDRQWRFHKGGIENNAHPNTDHAAIYNGTKTGMLLGAATKRAYDDSEWEIVDIPHDYIRESAFSPDAIGNHGYREMFDGWYRKTFTIDSSYRGKQALLVFDGIALSSTIFLNGSIIERSFSAYSEIVIDITDRLYYDRINTLAVFVKGDDIQGWWYEGAGIYKHVALYFKNPVHIAHNGIWANPVLLNKEKNAWSINLDVTLENSFYEATSVTVQADVYDEDKLIAQGVSAPCLCGENEQTSVQMALSISDPIRWDVDNPKLYTVKVSVLHDCQLVDEDSVRIGFRTYHIDAQKGFFLNDRPLKIKGTCNHQDHAGVGVAVPDSIQRYRVRLLKEMGTNAYRSAHNPISNEILDACDELGLIVMDENRTFETRADVISALENQVRRVRNHPSLIFYSLFNEEHLQSCTEGKNIYRRLQSCVKKLDNTRITLGAINDIIHPDGAGPEMDVLGINYNTKFVHGIHEKYPDRPMIGTENNSAFATRGCYHSDREVLHILNCYDEEYPFYGENARGGWDLVRKNDYYAGYFVWTGFDYRGEPSPFTWPSCSSQFGIMDTCGFPKDSYYFHKAAFTQEPMMHILPHWNWTEGDIVRVMTVTNCQEVELILNGRSLGKQTSDVCTQCQWQVPFEKGTLKAIGYIDGQKVSAAEVATAGTPKSIRLLADRNSIHNAGQDTVPVRVSVVDDNGVEVPTASHLIRFEVEGDGYIAGVGNGDPNSHEPEHLPFRKLYCGLCQVLATADAGAKSLKLKATADGLISADLSFDIEERKTPAYLPLKPNHSITGVSVSLADSEVKPDPSRVYGITDMNSFAPIVIDNQYQGNHTPGFVSGWREYRIPVVLPKKIEEGKRPAIQIESINCNKAEFYINGQLIWEGAPDYKSTLIVPLKDIGEREFEVRALLEASSNKLSTSGFGIGMTLTYLAE